MPQDVGLEHAAVEKHMRRSNGLPRRRSVGLQEGGQVAGDGRVGLVGQAKFAETGGRPPGRPIADLAVREEAIDEQLPDALPIDVA